MGLDPMIARLSGAFVSGGVLGVGGEGASFIKSGLEGFLLQGVNEMALHLGVPPVGYFDGTNPVETIMPSDNMTFISPKGYTDWTIEARAVYVNYANKVGVIGGNLLDAVQKEQENYVTQKLTDNTVIRDPILYEKRFQDTKITAEKVGLAFQALDLLNDAAKLKEAFSNGGGIYNMELQSKTYSDGRRVERWVVYIQENESSKPVYLTGAGAEQLAKEMLQAAKDNGNE